MAPSPPYRRGSHRPRVDSQQETGNPGRRNPQRRGVGRHCGRSTGVALYLMHTCYAKRKHTPNHSQPHQTTKTQTDPYPPPEKPTRTKTKNEKNTEPANERRQKKNRCGAKPWGRCGARSTGWSRTSRPGQRNTRGNTSPQGFVVPQHLRERERETERKREKRSRRTSQQPRKKRDNEHQSDQGAGLEGHQTKQHLDPRDQKYQTNKPNIYPESIEQKNNHQANSVSEDFSPQGGGAHGPPCTFGETPQGTAVPKGTSTPPLREPPPVAQKLTTDPTQDQYPKSFVPALGRS